MESERLYLKGCWNGSFDLRPDFFAANPYRAESLQIRVQRGDNNQEASDGLIVLVRDLGCGQKAALHADSGGVTGGRGAPGAASHRRARAARVFVFVLAPDLSRAEQRHLLGARAITFNSLFSGDPNEEDSSARLTTPPSTFNSPTRASWSTRSIRSRSPAPTCTASSGSSFNAASPRSRFSDEREGSMPRSHPPTLITLVGRTLLEECGQLRSRAVLAAVSGGGDSQAMLSVLARLAPKLGLPVAGPRCGPWLTRGGRGRSLDKAEALAGFARGAVRRSRSVPRPGGAGNLQARAREARYAALREAARAPRCPDRHRPPRRRSRRDGAATPVTRCRAEGPCGAAPPCAGCDSPAREGQQTRRVAPPGATSPRFCGRSVQQRRHVSARSRATRGVAAARAAFLHRSFGT